MANALSNSWAPRSRDGCSILRYICRLSTVLQAAIDAYELVVWHRSLGSVEMNLAVMIRTLTQPKRAGDCPTRTDGPANHSSKVLNRGEDAQGNSLTTFRVS